MKVRYLNIHKNIFPSNNFASTLLRGYSHSILIGWTSELFTAMGIGAKNALAISRPGCVAAGSCGNYFIYREVQVVTAQSLMSSFKALGMSLSISESSYQPK